MIKRISKKEAWEMLKGVYGEDGIEEEEFFEGSSLYATAGICGGFPLYQVSARDNRDTENTFAINISMKYEADSWWDNVIYMIPMELLSACQEVLAGLVKEDDE